LEILSAVFLAVSLSAATPLLIPATVLAAYNFLHRQAWSARTSPDGTHDFLGFLDFLDFFFLSSLAFAALLLAAFYAAFFFFAAFF